MKRRIILILLLVLLVATAADALTKFETVSLEPGQGLFVPCSSGLVTAYVDDGMAVVECHAPVAQNVERRK
jgi:hypothetical protein